MTDTDTSTDQPARKRARPKKRFAIDRSPLRERLREPLRDDAPHANFVYQPSENVNPLHIDSEILRSIEHDYGYRLQWNAETVLGQPQEQAMASHRCNVFRKCAKAHLAACWIFSATAKVALPRMAWC
jgi:hypothetical protein